MHAALSFESSALFDKCRSPDRLSLGFFRETASGPFTINFQSYFGWREGSSWADGTGK